MITKKELEDFVDYIYNDEQFIITRAELRVLISDYLNDIHTEECEARQERNTPSEYFNDEMFHNG